MNILKLIVVSGLPGSGKSTVSEAIAEQLKFPIFSVDPIESSILKSGLAKNYETGLAAYIVTQNLASEQLKLGMSIIIDAVNPVNEARAIWHKLEKEYNAKLIIIECTLDKEIHKKRLHDRVRNMHGIPEVTWEDIENRKKEYLPWQEQRLVLDTAQPHEENVHKALLYIEEVK